MRERFSVLVSSVTTRLEERERELVGEWEDSHFLFLSPSASVRKKLLKKRIELKRGRERQRGKEEKKATDWHEQPAPIHDFLSLHVSPSRLTLCSSSVSSSLSPSLTIVSCPRNHIYQIQSSNCGREKERERKNGEQGRKMPIYSESKCIIINNSEDDPHSREREKERETSAVKEREFIESCPTLAGESNEEKEREREICRG